MLIELVVEELGVIQRAELSLDAGSVALTGETGAGKTLLVAALGLLMGGRADRDLVRRGASQSRVEGRFSVRPDHPCAQLAREQDLVADAPDDPDGLVELVLARVVPADGRPSKARINGRIVSAATLTAFGRGLIGIAGQNEHGRLADPAVQRALLDAAAGERTSELASEVATAVRTASASRRAAQELRAGERARSRELDVLRYEIAEIEAAAIEPGEGDRLIARAASLEDQEHIAVALNTAQRHLEGDGGALEDLAGAISALREAGLKSETLKALVDRSSSVEIELSDISGEIARATQAPEPESVEEIRGRIGELQRLRRKYGADDAEVLEYLEQASARAAELESATSRADELEAEAASLHEEAVQSAAELTARRLKAAKTLQAKVESRLAGLALSGARFQVEITPRELYEGGAETVSFAFGANAGHGLRPLAKTASGGELSRVALALHLVTATSDVETMMFDEVDAGVGGEAARSVGQALAELARTAGIQTLVVTHLPQVAAYADAHLRISKDSATQGVVSSVEVLTGDARIDELSRMLAGLPDSQVAQEHARELLEVARGAVPAA